MRKKDDYEKKNEKEYMRKYIYAMIAAILLDNLYFWNSFNCTHTQIDKLFTFFFLITSAKKIF